ncbi:MAG: hypothetical protein K8R28_11465 [Desulfobacterales bacterium]|nr:hypothetical protein [Desulfobacterales bacterium]
MSSYREELGSLSEDKIPVFIELKPDCFYPEHSILIDHHDERAGKDKKTSIEQVANLLCIKLDRHQQLISSNDKGHIPGMRKLCATMQEIDEIRALDRKAQGVLPEDEDKARKSVENHLEKFGDDTAIIESLTDKTSAVVDMIYDKYRHIFIYTPDGNMSYSGTGEMVCNLKNIFNEMQSGNPDIKYWSGGELPQQGYFGTNHQIEKDELKKMLNNWSKKIISQHILCFRSE